MFPGEHCAPTLPARKDLGDQLLGTPREFARLVALGTLRDVIEQPLEDLADLRAAARAGRKNAGLDEQRDDGLPVDRQVPKAKRWTLGQNPANPLLERRVPATIGQAAAGDVRMPQGEQRFEQIHADAPDEAPNRRGRQL